ncbi:hypothetical protein FACS189459_6840 [Bacilli bacterium]|nr:hypothetical protein FACS189459_6840 [Bacilli bacterium]
MDKAIITEAYELTGNKPTNNHISEYAKKTNTDISVGLSTDEAKKRLLEQGQNVLKQEKAESVFKIILQQFKDLLNVMLSFIAIADFASLPFMGDKKEDHLIQGIVIAVIVFFNVALSVYQEVKASKALDALKNTCTPIAKVMRDGKIQTINAKELVYGDVVYLEDGVIVPADLFLVETNSLKIEEGALTGESLPVEKDALVDTKENVALGDKVNYAFTSTMVTYGSGIGIVCSTGMHTEIGKIATMLTDSGNSKDLPPLKKKINKLVKILTIFAIALLVVMFVINGILFAAHIYPGFLSGNGDSYTYKF